MKPVMLIAAGTLVIIVGGSVTAAPQQPAQQLVQAQLPPGRVYAFHSVAQGGCPPLDWHIVLQPDGTLDGMISWNNMQSVARTTGSINPQTRVFQMYAMEVGGQVRAATIDGTVNPQNGLLTASIRGPTVTCQGIQVPYLVPYQG